MKTAISIVLAIGLTFSNLAVAKESGENMEAFKQKLAQHIDTEITILTQFKTCIQAAQNRDDLKNCQESRKQAQKQLTTEMKKDRLEWRKQKLATEEQKLNDSAKSGKNSL